MEGMDAELKNAINQIKPAMVATAGKNGHPNVSPKGSLRVIDDRHLAFADIRSPQSIENLRENPYISAIGFDPTPRKGWRIWGKAEEILSSGELYDQFCREYADRGKVNHVVKVLVEKGVLF